MGAKQMDRPKLNQQQYEQLFGNNSKLEDVRDVNGKLIQTNIVQDGKKIGTVDKVAPQPSPVGMQKTVQAIAPVVNVLSKPAEATVVPLVNFGIDLSDKAKNFWDWLQEMSSTAIFFAAVIGLFLLRGITKDLRA